MDRTPWRLRNGATPPPIVGLHHLRIPVSDVLVCRDWYIGTLGFRPVLVEEDEDSVTGAVIEHPSGVIIGLHRAPELARSLRGFAVMGLAVDSVDEWASHLEALAVPYHAFEDSHLGRCLAVEDPDGVVIELHTPDQPSVDEA
jgi:catechol 2,3-dioxygenase-like lactoylglutathione lyase family enzyme